MTLHLKPDGRVRFIHDYFNNDLIEETGVWKESRDRTTTITLTGLDKGRLYRKPDVITFRLVGDHLVAVKYDHYIHGYRGLRLKRTAALSSPSPMKQVEEESVSTGTAEPNVAVHRAEPVNSLGVDREPPPTLAKKNPHNLGTVLLLTRIVLASPKRCRRLGHG